MSNKKRLLTVDDSLVVHKVLDEIFKGSGFEIIGRAFDGVQAVSLYFELRPDVVLLDINMPQKDGLEALKEIMERDPSAKVIMASSYGTESAVEEALSRGAKGFIQKPYDPQRLLALLEKRV